MHDVRVTDAAGSFPLDADDVASWAGAVLEGETEEEATLSITFVDTDAMRRLNREALGRDRPTDVIAFRLEDPSGLVGDVYVCPAVAGENATAAGVATAEELVRLVVHGVLHVLGHDHPEEPGDRVVSSMWRLQERYVRVLADAAPA
jgi:probable rRNA maturation factor